MNSISMLTKKILARALKQYIFIIFCFFLTLHQTTKEFLAIHAFVISITRAFSVD